MPEAAPARPGPWATGILDVEGHRGARGLVVESTLASFDAALAAGVTGIELDARLTADGQVVVWHDPVLEASKCHSTAENLIGARVDDLSMAQLRTVDVGSKTLPQFPSQRAAPGATIATLDEVVDRGQARSPGVWWTIELKVDPTDERQSTNRERLLEATLEVIGARGIEGRCFVHSFDWAVLELARELAPAVLRSALTMEGHFTAGSPWTGSIDPVEHGLDLVSAVEALGARVISPHHRLVDADLVQSAHDHGLAVLPWTVNDDADLTGVLDLGVDGIVTDFPDRARALVDARGVAAP